MIPLPRPAALLALLTALLFPAVLRAETVLSFPGNPAAPGALLLSPDSSGFSFGRTNDFAVEMFLMLEGSGAATETVFANMPVSNTLATGGPGCDGCPGMNAVSRPTSISMTRMRQARWIWCRVNGARSATQGRGPYALT